jgi:NitT/TauT family transport system substrate-binding protein
MKKGKIFTCLVLVAILAVAIVLFAVGKKEDNTSIRIASLKGPTTIGMVKMMDDFAENEKYDFSMYANASEISPLLIKGEIDIASIPANLAATLYAKTAGEVCVLNTNTMGVLYLVGTDGSLQSFEDIKGKTIYSTGKGTTPEYSLNYLIHANGFKVEEFNVEYKSEATEVVAALEANPEAVAVLPQPFVLTAQAKLAGLQILMSFNDEWERVSSDSQMITGVTVVRRSFLEEHPEYKDLTMKLTMLPEEELQVGVHMSVTNLLMERGTADGK